MLVFKHRSLRGASQSCSPNSHAAHRLVAMVIMNCGSVSSLQDVLTNMEYGDNEL